MIRATSVGPSDRGAHGVMRERERRKDPADEPQVPPDRDVRDREREREAEHDQPERLAGERPGRQVLEHEQGAYDPVDRAGCPHRDREGSLSASAPAEPAMPETKYTSRNQVPSDSSTIVPSQ